MNDSTIPDDLQTAVSRGLRLAGFSFAVDTMLTVAREVRGMMTRKEALAQAERNHIEPVCTTCGRLDNDVCSNAFHLKRADVQAEQDWLTKPDPADTDWDEVPWDSGDPMGTGTGY